MAALCLLTLAGQKAGANDTAAPLQLAQLAAPAPGVRIGAAAKAPRLTLANDSTEAALLRQAYAKLFVADHDYDGHRARAMRQIEAAAKTLGVDLKGDGKGHEPQATSDENLRAAQQLLEQITGAVAGEGLKHIQLAIEQLSVALAIR